MEDISVVVLSYRQADDEYEVTLYESTGGKEMIEALGYGTPFEKNAIKEFKKLASEHDALMINLLNDD